MLDVVGDHGIVYFGQRSVVGGKASTALFICPLCNETFRSGIANVRHNNTTQCGCKKRGSDG